MLVIDVSLSMQATDVEPTRLAAAQAAAKEFADQLTPGVNLGLVAFAGTAAVLVSPTTDRASVKRAIDGLQLAESHRHRRGDLRGDVVDRDVLASRSRATQDGPPPARIVLMSDGKQTVPGPDARTSRAAAFTAARKAAEAKVPVSTISFGTDYGSIEIDGDRTSVAVDDASMRRDRGAVGRRSSSPRPARRSCGRSTPSWASRSATRCGGSTRAGPWMIAAVLLLAWPPAGIGAGAWPLGRRHCR